MNDLLTLGLVHNWPGKKNSEFDIIGRLRPLIESLGHRALIIDPLGYVLNEDGIRKGGAPVEDGTLDAVINLHYLNPKYFSGLSYVVNWNPIDYLISNPITGEPVPRQHLEYLADCLRSHDRVLSAGSTVLDQYAAAIRKDIQGRALPEAELKLHTTISANRHDVAAPPSEESGPDSFSVFYIGMNWEKLSVSQHRKVRHEGLLELLDQSGRFCFYGLREQSGQFLWEGFNHYQGELPFDGGKSIIEQSRRCGVVLVMSSPQHRRSAVVSTRIFQACAAGAIIISDDNPFVREHFGDSVLYFNYGADNQQTANNILAQVQWIEQNWQQAKEMAARASEIFSQRFALDLEIEALCDQIEKDRASRIVALKNLVSRSVAVHYILAKPEKTEIQQLLDNVSCQNHQNVNVYLYSDSTIRPELKELLDSMVLTIPVCVRDIDDVSLTVGVTFTFALEGGEDYHLWYSRGFEWRRDHLANLLQVCEHDQCELTYSPYFAVYPDLLEDIDDTMRFFITGLNGGYSRLTADAIARIDRRDLPLGNILIRSTVLEELLPSQPMIQFFDMGSLSLLLRTLYELRPEAIGFSSVITSLHTGAEGSAHRSIYREEECVDAQRLQWAVRDRNLFAMMLAGNSVVTGIPGKHEQDFASDDPLEVSTLISRNFSYPLYMDHVLKNQPWLRKGFNGLHRLVARLLRL